MMIVRHSVVFIKRQCFRNCLMITEEGMNKQPEITEATRGRIIEAFWSIFQTTPVEKITIARLSAAAGIHRSSFYRYFADVYQVFDDFQAELLVEITAAFTAVIDSETISLTQYSEATAVVLSARADKLYRLLNYADGTFKAQLLDLLMRMVRKTLKIDAQTPDADYLTSLITSCMLSNFNYWYEHREQYTLAALNRTGQEILLGGVLAYITRR